MTFANAMDMVALFLSVQRTPTSKPPRDYLIFPFTPFFKLSFLKSFLTCVLPLFSSCCRYLIMAGWAGSTMVWVTYDRYINGPPPDALSVRVALSFSLSSSLSLSLLPLLPQPFPFPFPFIFIPTSVLQRTQLSRTATIIALLFSDV